MSNRQIAIFKEKHGNRYYDIDHEGGWDRVCMAVFRERDAEGWWYNEPGPEPVKPEPPEDLTDAKAVGEYSQKLKAYPRELRWWKEQQRTWEQILLARDGNMPAARYVVENRKDHEYEGFYLETFDEAPDDTPRWKYASWQQVAHLGTGIIHALGGRWSPERMAEEWEEYTATTTDPLPLEHREPPTNKLNKRRSPDRQAIMIRSLYRRLQRSPEDLRVQDDARRVLLDLGFVYDGASLERRRLEKFGTPEAIADARFEARCPPGSRYRDDLEEDPDEMARERKRTLDDVNAWLERGHSDDDL